MTLRRGMAALLLACAAAAALPSSAQGSKTYEVRRGDTLFGVARKEKHDGVTRNQMILAIWRANQNVFPGGNVNILEVGAVLAIPAREAVVATDPVEADRLVGELLLRPTGATQSVAGIKSAVPGAVAPPGRQDAIRRYQEGLALEAKGDESAALKAFLEAGEAGYGLAQRKLGQIYDKGNSAVQRDYQTSLLWYRKAREQGVEIDKPLPRIVPPTK